VVELRNDGTLGWDVMWSPCYTDWTWDYTLFGLHRSEQRMRHTSRHERKLESAQYSSTNSGNCHQGHLDATICQWMVVIMKYDMADNLRYNLDRRRRNQKRRTTRKALPQKKSIQTTMKPLAETSITSSTACKGITRNANKRSTAPLKCVLLWSLQKWVVCVGKKLLATLENAGMLTL
jgi:hypothetical protein